MKEFLKFCHNSTFFKPLLVDFPAFIWYLSVLSASSKADSKNIQIFFVIKICLQEIQEFVYFLLQKCGKRDLMTNLCMMVELVTCCWLTLRSHNVFSKLNIMDSLICHKLFFRASRLETLERFLFSLWLDIHYL